MPRGWRIAGLAAAACAIVAALPAGASAQYTSCRGNADLVRGVCRVVEQGGADLNALLAPGPARGAVAAFQGTWADRALALQYELAGDVGLRNAPWVGTHNSFNSIAEMGPTLSDLDSNQQLTLTEQLRVGVRSLELDLHWWIDFRSLAFAPVVCHARDPLHLGCTIEKSLPPVLAELRAWLDANPGQVLLLYLEDHLDGPTGSAAAARMLDAGLGDRIYRPSGACEPLPLDLTRDQVRAAGKQVLLMSNCAAGGEWNTTIFDGDAREETRPRGYTDFPACGPDFDRAEYESKLIRYYEDSTALTALTTPLGQATNDDGITPATAARMARCGVDLTGLDQLLPFDGRLEALVWSWAPNQPAAAGDCAVQRRDARWEARGCGELHPAACRAGDGTWSLTPDAVAAAAAEAACIATGAEHAVPRTGFEGQLLAQAAGAAGAAEVWLGHRRSGTGWVALDPRS
jgi:hypothetical protein